MGLYVNPTFAKSFVLCTICMRNASALRKFARTGRVVRAKKKTTTTTTTKKQSNNILQK